MIVECVVNGLKRGKARFLCAAAGIAAATGAVVFMFSLTATNNAQAPALARQAAQPWGAWRVEGIRLMGRGGPGSPSRRVTRTPPPSSPSEGRVPRPILPSLWSRPPLTTVPAGMSSRDRP